MRDTEASHAGGVAAAEQLHELVAGAAAPSRSYFVLVVLSAAIAAFGLLANSAPVVIGAMIVAPLMGPILGIALGLASGDRPLFWRSLAAEGGGVVLGFGLSWLIGLLPWWPELGSEILARTQPSLLDLLVAIAAGLAAAYACLDLTVSPALPGVAIAVALVPPLASSGLCLAAGQPRAAGGAFLLYVANLLAIHLAAAVLFAAMRLQAGPWLSWRSFARRFGLSLALLVVVTCYLTQTSASLLREQRRRTIVDRTLTEQLRTTTGAQLRSFRLDRAAGQLEAVAVVVTPAPIAPREVERIQSALRAALNEDLRLIIRSLLSSDADAAGPVYGLDADAAPTPEQTAEAELLARATAGLRAALARVPNAELTAIERHNGTRALALTAEVQSPWVLGPDQVAVLQGDLARRLGQPVELVVRTVSATVADATGFTTEATSPGPPPLPAADHARLQTILRRRLAAAEPAALLLGLLVEASPAGLAVQAVVQSPRALGAATVRQMEALLQRYVRPDIRLVMHIRLASVVSSTGELAVPVESPILSLGDAAPPDR